jgi:GNAT superfamily N-acetyltransferase
VGRAIAAANDVRVIEVAWDHPDAAALRAALTAELDERYADRLADDAVPAALHVAGSDVAYTGLAVDATGAAVGHCALRRSGTDAELKRMYVTPGARGGGVGAALLAAAEAAAGRLGADRVVLQTGDRQPDAVALYRRAGYTPIPAFPPYDRLAFSRCFGKAVTTGVSGARTPHPC